MMHKQFREWSKEQNKLLKKQKAMETLLPAKANKQDRINYALKSYDYLLKALKDDKFQWPQTADGKINLDDLTNTLRTYRPSISAYNLGLTADALAKFTGSKSPSRSYLHNKFTLFLFVTEIKVEFLNFLKSN